MTVITSIVGAGTALVVGFVAFYAWWRHRLAARLERVPVRAERPEDVFRPEGSSGRRAE